MCLRNIDGPSISSWNGYGYGVTNFVRTVQRGRGDTDGAKRRSRMQDKPIVVGIDGSSDSRQALQWATDFGQRYQIAVRAMTVWDTPPTYGRVSYAAPESAHGQSEARAMLADVVRTVVADNANVTQRIEQGDPGPVLVHEAAEAELLVV